ncbi:MAG: GIY-YIG nuclease family protein [Clostridia bacterium]|nr:GIY-YIG nuclease family protein [Clostridia bacterium]
MKGLGETGISYTLPAAPGVYALVLRLPSAQPVRVGSLGEFTFCAGAYVYVGSALGGLAARVGRHLQGPRKARWHIDYLARAAPIAAVIFAETTGRLECSLAALLAGRLEAAVPGFGASDCGCFTHLYFAAQEGLARAAARESFVILGLGPREAVVAGRPARGY